MLLPDLRANQGKGIPNKRSYGLTIAKETKQEHKEMSLNISLLALSKVAASILYTIQRNEPDDAILELFIATVVESLNHLDKQGFAREEAQDIIDKLRGKQ